MNIFELQMNIAIINIIMQIILNILFIKIYSLGLYGAILTKNIADIICTLILHFVAKHKKYYDIFQRPFDKESLS